MSHPLLPPLHKLPKREKNSTLLGWAQQWLGQVEPTLSRSSQGVVRCALQSMFRGLAGKAPTTENLHLWLRARCSVDRISPATLQLERVYTGRFFNWCVLMGYMGRNPLKPIPSVPVPVKTNRPVITEEQFERLKAVALAGSSGFYYPMIISWYTGARLVDVVYMRWSDVSLHGPESIWTFTPKKTRTKGTVVIVPLAGPILDALTQLRELQDEHGYVFPYLQALHERRDGSLQRLFRAVRDSAGLPKNVTFHCFRHTRMTRMLNSETPVDILTAADLLGLSSLNTLRKYNHASLRNKQKAMSL